MLNRTRLKLCKTSSFEIVLMVDRSKASTAAGTSQRAAIACQSCRLRKVKCDAQFVSPDEACGPCRRSGQECLLDPLADGRSRKCVDRLQQRIETLEALNKHIAGGITRGSDDDHSSPPEATIVVSGDIRTARTTPQNTDRPEPAPARTPQEILPPVLSVGKKTSEDTLDEASCFYGATSHPHVVSPSEETCITTHYEEEVPGIDLDLDSPRLRDQLVQSFFKYQLLWVDVVNKERYLAHQARTGPSRWFSKFLENAILACGTRLSTSKTVRALGPKYCELAKQEILRAMSEPTPANLQGFLLLSEYEVTQGNDRQGWMFCGMATAKPLIPRFILLTKIGVACRMLSDLGLHELGSIISAPKEVQEPTTESDLAYALLSACVVYEGVWTLYLGRPSSISRSVMNAVASRCREMRKSDSPWLNAWVGLCLPMAEMSLLLNEQSSNDSHGYTSLRKLSRQVEDWHENLPPELAYNESRLTNMDLAGYGLHTQYCKVQILLQQALDRPINPRKRRYSQLKNDKTPQPSSENSNPIVYQFALRIARLIVTYREAFGVEKIPSIMLDNAVVAATVMIGHQNAVAINNSQHENIWLRQLVKSMETVQPHFPIVGRMLDTLKQICGSNSLRSIFPSARRDSTNGSHHELSPAHRSVDLNSGSQIIQGNLEPVKSGPGIVWDCLDTSMPPNIFTSGGFDDFVFDSLPIETWVASSRDCESSL